MSEAGGLVLACLREPPPCPPPLRAPPPVGIPVGYPQGNLGNGDVPGVGFQWPRVAPAKGSGPSGGRPGREQEGSFWGAGAEAGLLRGQPLTQPVFPECGAVAGKYWYQGRLLEGWVWATGGPRGPSMPTGLGQGMGTAVRGPASLTLAVTQVSALREIVETWDESSGGFPPLPERWRGPKGHPGERGPQGKEVCAGCLWGALWRVWLCSHRHLLSAPPGAHRLLRRPRAEGRSRRPRPSGATWPGPWGEGPPWTSRPGRGAWKAWYSWAPRLSWGCGGGRKARRKGEPGGWPGGPGMWGQEELDSPQTYSPPCYLCVRENAERKENAENR